MGQPMDAVVLNKLAEVLCFDDGRRLDQEGMVARGPIIRGKGCDPSRIVLRLVGDEYVIHEEVWRDHYLNMDDTFRIAEDSCSGFINGDYIPLHKPGRAFAIFVKRLLDHAERNLPIDHKQVLDVLGDYLCEFADR